MFERFTPDGRRVVVLAQEEARMLHHRTTGSEHLLLGLLGLPGGTAAVLLGEGGLDLPDARSAVQRLHAEPGLDAEALDAIGIDLDAVREKVEAVFGIGALSGASGSEGRRRQGAGRLLGGHLPFTADAKKVLELSLREALAAKSREILPEHLLLGLLRADGPAARLLTDHGFGLAILRARTLATLA